MDQRPSGISQDTGRVYCILCRKMSIFYTPIGSFEDK